jgi:hypothetical protein
VSAALRMVGDDRPPRAPWCKSCGACQRRYGSAEWGRLPLITSLPHDRVQPHLSVPAVWTVELRRCDCGAELAARSR